jgi:exosortase/archaeosortase family protein
MAPWLRRQLRPAIAISILIGAFVVMVDPIRTVEAEAAAGLARGILGVSLVPYGWELLLAPRQGPVFFGIVTESCSSAPLLAGLGAVAGLLLPRRLHRRTTAFLVAALLVTALNVLRLVISIWVGSRFGMERMATFHDLIGTPLMLFGSAAGVILLWRVAAGPLPRPQPS